MPQPLTVRAEAGKKIVKRLFHAVFDGEKQITAWDKRKDKVLSRFRQAGINRKGDFTLRSRTFIQKVDA